ncbi:uncharacterized protein ACHE_20458A [Aspergillus chevalieri]|uniref:Guanine nucleotide-exchange factor SEC12 n=1 Tax=Aspergillus chevalieri TaxID=182096 RepID=A0A7R7VHT9_ASPCH|nr:uncharacterized protein ACHE_20458A [Aspergillus chevalieri]BCR85000.1 hypothetical protein ACHE_20458A [Aspergillus chevalieri]
MAPAIPSAKLTLSCPLFAADFDPRNSDYLLVGGGGGEGRSGVGNRIALLNTSKRDEITESTEIELSRDEDSVMSMAVAQASEDSMISLAGINSSTAEQKRDNNQHLRSFKIDLPKKQGEKKMLEKTTIPVDSVEKSTLLSRTSLFRTKGAKAGSDTYQRIVRISPWRGEKLSRVGAITTGLAQSGEIVFFQAISMPKESDVIGRIRLSDGEEAGDIDIIDSGKEDGKFRVAYTNGVDVFTCQISSSTRSSTAPDVSRVYTIPLLEKGKRPKFRALRFLSPTSLLLLQNAPDRSGSELVVLSLPASNEKNKAVTIVRRKKLRKTIKMGLGLDVCNLGTGAENDQTQQIIIAVTGSDQSIELLTLEYNPEKGYGKLWPYASLHDVHPFSVTRICFSTFTPPSHPVTPEVGPQYIKLASVSMGNTVVVHTIPLSPFPVSSRTPRYVLAIPGESETWATLLSGFTALFTVLIVCVLLQGYMEIKGGAPSYLGVSEWLPPQVQSVLGHPTPSLSVERIDTSTSSIPTATTTISVIPNTNTGNQRQSLRDILRPRQEQEAATDAVTAGVNNNIIVRCTTTDDGTSNEILIETIPSEQQIQDETRPWEELGEEQQSLWKQRLADAGHWAVEEGETILKGVLFAEYCGFVRELVGEELL